MQQIDASIHFGLYGILQATFGFIASYLTFSVAPLHVIGSNVILLMVALHFEANVWHTLIARDDTLDRMITPRSDQPTTWTVNRAQTMKTMISSRRTSATTVIASPKIGIHDKRSDHFPYRRYQAEAASTRRGKPSAATFSLRVKAVTSDFVLQDHKGRSSVGKPVNTSPRSAETLR
jgi:hypothetical protein